MKKLNAEQFIIRAIERHGTKYDYSKVEYLRMSVPVIIVCPVHGEFTQLPSNHLTSGGCKKCGDVSINKKGRKPKVKWTTESFIEKSHQVHQNKYLYEKTIFVKTHEKIVLTCPIHGDWLQTPNDHLQGYGCPKCGEERTTESKRKTLSVFIEESKKIHDDVYDYSLVKYKNAKTKVLIKCKIHGTFNQTPDKHLQGIGCPKCSYTISKGERKIQIFFEKNNIIYEREKRYKELYGATKNAKLRFDFYLPNFNTLIEYDGEHHFFPVCTKGKLSPTEARAKHQTTTLNDGKKTKFSKEHKIPLIRISYLDYDNIDTILQRFISATPV